MTALSLKAQEWYRQRIDENISIKFPSVPKLVDTTAQTTFTSLDKDAIYLVTVTDLKDLLGFQPASKDDVNEFYRGEIKQMLLRYHGDMIHVNEFFIKDIKGAEMEFTFHHPSGFLERRFVRFLIINEDAITIQIGTRGESSSLAMEKKNFFFNSFKLHGKDTDWWQYDSDSSSRSSSMLAHLIVKWIPIALLAWGIYALIKYIGRR
ncbi:MAG TPA: hypothetical protein VIM89_20910 [Mucilaginibacter sp.]